MITMETMKASRRKQTKPNRVPFGMDPLTGAFNASLPPAPPVPEEDPLPRHNGGMDSGRDADEGDVPLDMHVSIISCSMCPETFPTGSDLREHMDTVHGSLPKKSRMDSAEFPTEYHRLASELCHDSSIMSNGHGEEQAQALSLTKPKPTEPDSSKDVDMDTPRSGGDQNLEGRSVKADGGKIFHPDAYCALCDKEFCNKYFLKTHRANKHGIYDSSSPTTPLPPDVPQPPVDSPFQAPPPQKVELSPSPWQQQQQAKKENRTENSQQPSNNSKKSESDLATAEKVSRVLSAVMMSSQSDSKTSSSSSSSNSGSTPKDSTMEDYCEHCQKRFCNKYYLKKHKQDVHGIIPETGPTTSKRSRASSSLLDLPMSSTSMGSPMLLPQPMPSLAGMPALPPGVMVLNPFMPQMTLIPTGNMPQPLLHPHQLHPPPHSPVMSQPLPLPGTLPGMSPTTPTSQASQLSPNRETFCTICRKEFNNGYFLKIHKANRHGIQSEDIPPEAKLLGDMVESNGVVVPPRPPSKDVKQEGYSRSSPPPLTSINQMVTCRQCDKDFPNAQAFKIHQITEHGKNLEPALPDSYESSLPKSEAPVSCSETLQRMSSDVPPAHGNGGGGRDGGGTMFGNMVAAKLADRVVCDICNKDLCNKYFLKSHKAKMHGIHEDDNRTSAGDKMPPLPSPTMSSSKNQPLNMTMSPKPQGPPGLIMPKMEMRDFPDSSRDFKMMEKYGAMKGFADVPSFLSETINNEYLRRAHPQPPFKGLDFGMPGLVPTSSANLSHEQLVEEGIDPEAYCDICKKEFCSKYFLRTHKKNIHGINVEVPPPDRSRAKPGPKPAMNKLGGMGGANNGNPLAGLPMPGMPFNFPPAMMMGGGGAGVGNSGYGRARDAFEKHQFRWKDPSNASQRVTCDICNKEVCNKYFLRTHKLKKHGISPSETSLSPMSGSPVPSENDASSNHSSQPDNFLLDKGTGTYPRPDSMAVPQTIPLPPSERSSSKSGEPPKMSKSEEEKAYLHGKHNNNNSSNNNHNHNSSSNNNNNRDSDSVTCNLCERKFKNMQWLSAHMMKDHAEVCNPSFLDMCMLQPLGIPPPFDAHLDPKVCQVCRQYMPNEIALQLHLIQEHNAQVRLQMDETPSPRGQSQGHQLTPATGSSRTVGLKAVKPWKSAARKQGLTAVKKQKMYVCSACDYNTHWLSKLQTHEENAHAILPSGVKKQGYSVASFLGNGGSESSPKKSLKGVKQFKCGLCPSRFTTHDYCQMHLREAHIHMLKDFVSRKRHRGGKKLSCSLCTFSTSFLFRLHTHMARFHHRLCPPAKSGSSSSLSRGEADSSAVNNTTAAQEPTGGESLQSSPTPCLMETPSFERPASPEELMKQAFRMAGDDNGTALNLSDKFLPMHQRVHDPVTAPFRMAEVTP